MTQYVKKSDGPSNSTPLVIAVNDEVTHSESFIEMPHTS